MKAVVLVGGFGTRLHPLTLTTPKPMLPVVDRPMIEWVVGALATAGVEEAVLSLGFRPDAFEAAYPDGVCAGVRLYYAIEPHPLDTAGAIRFAARAAGLDERFLAVNGDVLADIDVAALVAFHDSAGAEATLALHRVVDPSAYGVVCTDDDGRVEAFVEKPNAGEAPSNLINAGTYVLEPSVLDRIDDGRKVSIERETFPTLVANQTLFALDSGDAYWLDTGTPAQYLQAQLDVLDGRRGEVRDGICPAAEVHPDAIVRRSVVRASAQIDKGATVVDSLVLPGATIEVGATITRSIVGPNATVGEGASLDDLTVIGEGVVVEPGAVLAGCRIPFPED